MALLTGRERQMKRERKILPQIVTCQRERERARERERDVEMLRCFTRQRDGRVHRGTPKRGPGTNNPGGRKGRKRGRREKKGKRERGRGMQNQWDRNHGLGLPRC